MLAQAEKFEQYMSVYVQWGVVQGGLIGAYYTVNWAAKQVQTKYENKYRNNKPDVEVPVEEKGDDP